MAKILISWNATMHDFIRAKGSPTVINENGIHAEFYQQGFKYDKHYLLNTSSPKNPSLDGESLQNHLALQNKWPVELVCMDIKDPISVPEIHRKLSEFMLELRKEEIEVIISPGTPAMQTAWYLIASSQKFKAQFFNIRPLQHRVDGKYVREPITVEKAELRESIIIQEDIQRRSRKHPHIFMCPSNESVFEQADLVASTRNVTAMITGETGTGKEVIADYIHKQSDRMDEPFIAINCAAYGDELLESRLFGHLKGAFTNATTNQKGAFEEAHGGTIFLDEIGDITPKMQQTLLRVLQERTFAPIGSFKKKKSDVRVIVATNKDLWGEVQTGNFRMDLYYRISTMRIQMPALCTYANKDKKAFITRLIKERGKEEFGAKPFKLTKEAYDFLLAYRFLGNVRELINLIDSWHAHRLKLVDMRDITSCIRKSKQLSSLKLNDMEAQHIQKVLDMFSHSTKKKVLDTLGITNNTLDKKVKKYELRISYK